MDLIGGFCYVIDGEKTLPQKIHSKATGYIAYLEGGYQGPHTTAGARIFRVGYIAPQRGQNIKQASLTDLESTKGISKTVAKNVYDSFNSPDNVEK